MIGPPGIIFQLSPSRDRYCALHHRKHFIMTSLMIIWSRSFTFVIDIDFENILQGHTRLHHQVLSIQIRSTSHENMKALGYMMIIILTSPIKQHQPRLHDTILYDTNILHPRLGYESGLPIRTLGLLLTQSYLLFLNHTEYRRMLHRSCHTCM